MTLYYTCKHIGILAFHNGLFLQVVLNVYNFGQGITITSIYNCHDGKLIKRISESFLIFQHQSDYESTANE